jgi:succinate dehydrogenase (ubiquinone) cytochrome b560 subunit
VSTENIPAVEAGSIIAAQRKHRPISPHLSIYKPQITWYLSILHRITGGILSGGISLLNLVNIGVYVFGAAYLVAPVFGWHLDVASMAAAFGSLPAAAKFGIKSIIAFPFAYHSINGLRHLTWDTGASMYSPGLANEVLTNKQVIRTGWTVVGLTAVTTLYLAML